MPTTLTPRSNDEAGLIFLRHGSPSVLLPHLMTSAAAVHLLPVSILAVMELTIRRKGV
jgi:hypothetical protein